MGIFNWQLGLPVEIPEYRQSYGGTSIDTGKTNIAKS
jgi:hypothetical protein